MEEIITKSKFYKVGNISLSLGLKWFLCLLYLLTSFLHSDILQAQKARDKEENEHLVEELDKDFTSLVHSEALLSLTEPNKMKALKALVNTNEQSNKDHIPASRTIENSVQVPFIHELPLIIRTSYDLTFSFMAGKT